MKCAGVSAEEPRRCEREPIVFEDLPGRDEHQDDADQADHDAGEADGRLGDRQHPEKQGSHVGDDGCGPVVAADEDIERQEAAIRIAPRGGNRMAVDRVEHFVVSEVDRSVVEASGVEREQSDAENEA